TRPAVVSDLQSFEVIVDTQPPARAEPIEKPEIEPGTDDMRAKSLFDLPRQQLSRSAVDDTVHKLDRTPIEGRQLQEIGVWDDTSQREGSRHGHLDLPLQQRLAGLQIGKELSILEQLRRDLAGRSSLDASQIVPDDGIAGV